MQSSHKKSARKRNFELWFLPDDSISFSGCNGQCIWPNHEWESSLTHETLDRHDISFAVHHRRHHLTSEETILESNIFPIQSIAELRVECIASEGKSSRLSDILVIQAHKRPIMRLKCLSRSHLFLFPWTDTLPHTRIPRISCRSLATMFITVPSHKWCTFPSTHNCRTSSTSHTAIRKCLLNRITRSHDTLNLNRCTYWCIFHSTCDRISRSICKTNSENTCHRYTSEKDFAIHKKKVKIKALTWHIRRRLYGKMVTKKEDLSIDSLG